jgi:membrane-associated phospholipid phosphatase
VRLGSSAYPEVTAKPTEGPLSAGGTGYRYRVLKARMPRSARVAGTLAIGGSVTVLTCWAVGRLLQHDAVVRPSRRAYDYVRDHRSAKVARRLEQAVTALGDFPVLCPFTILVGGMVAYERRDWRPLPLLGAGLVSEVYLQKALKRLVKGSKPPEEESLGPPGDFPSGGAARTVITFGLLTHLLAQRWDSPAEKRMLWAIATGLVAAQGGSRLYLGRHWPEDVLGGWLFGWLILRTLTRADELSA